MPRRFSFRPALTVRGRRFNGLFRGFAGKPFHPPLTDVPIGAYVLAAAFDVISWLWKSQAWAQDFYRAATFVLIGGAVVALATALTGFMDWLRSAPKGTQARRTASAHGITMASVTVLVLVDIALRLGSYSEPSTPIGIAILTVVAAVVTALGATIGGSLVFDYGFNVRTARDSAVWHESDRDLMPGEKP
ncbi:MAG TPA: DUF2231 domain-containing protein [Actinomycetota bacterium]